MIPRFTLRLNEYRNYFVCRDVTHSGKQTGPHTYLVSVKMQNSCNMRMSQQKGITFKTYAFTPIYPIGLGLLICHIFLDAINFIHIVMQKIDGLDEACLFVH
jgi:hypothetical protein